jgi:glycosyltransferase involved in cell wall biosynthesis
LPDIALISLGTTPGLRHADAAFADLVRGTGVSCEVVPVHIGREGKLRRHPAITDLVEAIDARRAARGVEARAIIYSTVTAALLQRPRVPFGVRFDATASLNRLGTDGAWQRRREAAVLTKANVLLPWSEAAASRLPVGHAPVVRLPIPVSIPPLFQEEREIDVTTYAAYPRKRGLELTIAAWAASRPENGRLVVGGADREKGLRWLERCGVPEPPGVEWAGLMPREEWLKQVANSRVFVNASRWEDYGIAQFEAVAAGTPVVTVPSPGQFEALPMLRELAPELVADDLTPRALGDALQRALGWDDAVRALYRTRARRMLNAYSRETLQNVIAEQVLPALGIEP